MLIKTLKDFDKHFDATDTCDACDRRLIAPPVTLINVGTTSTRVNCKYHFDCAKTLFYAILFDILGKPDIHQLSADTPET